MRFVSSFLCHTCYQSIQILHLIQDKMNKNRAVFKENMREVQWFSDSLLSPYSWWATIVMYRKSNS